MKQYEQVRAAMEDNGGYATFGFLYHKVDTRTWKTKTPYASIRRIVQDGKIFSKIKPGLWALKEQKQAVLKRFDIEDGAFPEKKQHFNHTYYQGLLLELGGLKKYRTYVPRQDKNKRYLGETPLGEMATLETLFDFTYPEVVNYAKTVDVIWFNQRKFPQAFYEIEHSTDMKNSLLKFHALQDFASDFYIVSDGVRKREFEQRIGMSAFDSIRKRVKFVDYEHVSALHTKYLEIAAIGDL